jgi:NitT/TauT family transport system permease protein
VKRKRFSVEQVVAVLKQAERGLPTRLMERTGFAKVQSAYSTEFTAPPSIRTFCPTMKPAWASWQLFWKVRLPNALPGLFGGLRVGITLAVVGAVVAEFVGADKGLGYLIQLANGRVDTPLLLAAVAMMSATGIVLYLIVERCEPLLRRAFA